jgi:thiosulfate reductase/polysulfide reductase chain A
VGLRQPVVPPLGEAKDLREIFPELARRIGGGMEAYFPWDTVEDYFREYFAPVPGGLEHMRTHGIWQDPAKRPYYQPYERELDTAELAGTTTDRLTGIVHRGVDRRTGEPTPVGVVVNGVVKRGFETPSRKLEVHSEFAAEKGRQTGLEVQPLPVYEPIPDHRHDFADDEFIMISYKSNVHNGHRTGQSAWLQEIEHTNPAWINGDVARALGLAEGDWIEVTSYRPRDQFVPHGDGSRFGSLLTRVHLTAGVHPAVLAIGHNNGRSRGGPIATNGTDTAALPGHAPGDHGGTPWWRDALSVAQNDLIPIYPDPTTGQQSFNDTLVRIRRVDR